MTREELKLSISHVVTNADYDESGEFLNVTIDAGLLYPFLQQLRNDMKFEFDYLFSLTCVDWKDHMMMVYHLLSRKHHHCVVVKAKIQDVIHPQIESVSGIWKTAELHENEVYDLFGVKFLNHPNLRRLFLEEDWKGFPLRKNYTDANMIKL